MNKTELSNWLQIGANIGILLGLILVGVQIRETNSIATAQFDSEDFLFATTAHDIVISERIGDIWGRVEANDQDISEEELAIVDSYITREWFRANQERSLGARGFVEADISTSAEEWVYQILGNEVALRWWTSNQIGLLDYYPELRDSINDKLAELGSEHRNYHKYKLSLLSEGALFPASVSDRF